MTPEIRRSIHAFRNALVPAADTRSNECFRMGQWQELNAFPHGCCALANPSFLALPVRPSSNTGGAGRYQSQALPASHSD
ncbi:TPA: hypothetical protein ACI7DF_004653 [Escherichia coli]